MKSDTNKLLKYVLSNISNFNISDQWGVKAKRKRKLFASLSNATIIIYNPFFTIYMKYVRTILMRDIILVLYKL